MWIFGPLVGIGQNIPNSSERTHRFEITMTDRRLSSVQILQPAHCILNLKPGITYEVLIS